MGEPVLRVDNREKVTRTQVQGALSVSTAQIGVGSSNLECLPRSEADSLSYSMAVMTEGAINQSQQFKGHKGGDRGTGQEGLKPL